ncbi:TPA: hypothetical protein IAD52_05650 [Candidatus Spyradomonas excrementavium]|nr:hypothetical protein [Candidatus Spyradomonas excrementavium]
MSYKNDGYLVIANKFGNASSAAKAEMFETYDRLRDLTVSGSALDGAGFGTAGTFLWNIARLIAPSAFMSVMGGTQTMNVPGTSYWSPISGANSILDGGSAAFGVTSLGNYPGFPNGAANVFWGFGSDTGTMTGGASALYDAASIGGSVGATSATYLSGVASGFGVPGSGWVLPTAGTISGIAGVVQAMAPYMGGFGLAATVAGNLLQGTSSAALAAYQNVSGRIVSNADTILSNRVRNIETVVKMLDTQGDIVKKMLKDDLEGDKKQVENM